MDINGFGRIPPQSAEAERSVIGSMLIDEEVIPVVTIILKSEDFYKENNKEIFEAIMELFDKGKPVDLITVADQLKLRGSLDNVGGLEYLATISADVPTTTNAKNYAEIVREKSSTRSIIKIASDAVNRSYEGCEEPGNIIEQTEAAMFKLLERSGSNSIHAVGDLLTGCIERLSTISQAKSSISGISTGFYEVDSKTAGLQNSDLVLIAARPAMGKTSFALNIAQHAAMHGGVPTILFSLEMSKEQLANRILCSEALVDSHKMKTGKLEDDDWNKLCRSLGPLSQAPLYIDDTAGISITDIRAKCRKMKIEKGIGLVVIDYLQLMQGGKSENRQQEISGLSRSLKILAKELNVPVVVLSQLSRAPEVRTDHRPILSDLRESGAIEQDADLVMMLYRDDYYNPDTEKKNIAEVIISKHRNGATGTIELVWLGQYTKFANLERR